MTYRLQFDNANSRRTPCKPPANWLVHSSVARKGGLLVEPTATPEVPFVMQRVEVVIHVPQDRLAEFYAIAGRWLAGETILPSTRRGTRRSRRTSGPSASSYAPLGTHLAKHGEGQALTLTFPQIETILDRPLPRSAYKHRAWWANTETHTQALTWLTAGWKVDHADLEQQAITFTSSHAETI